MFLSNVFINGRLYNRMPDGASVTVLFQDGTRIVYCVGESDCVTDLISKIKSDSRSPVDGERPLQLLYMGHILEPEHNLMGVSLTEEFTVQCICQRVTVQENSSGTSVGEGFDRLSIIGYTVDQIADIRSAFHTVAGVRDASRESQIALEDEWMPAMALEANPAAALRTVQLMSEHLGSGRPSINVTPLDMPDDNVTEAESPLLRQDGDSPVPVTDNQSWGPFSAGVCCGIILGMRMWFMIPVMLCGNGSFTIGLVFGMCLHVVLSMP